MGQRTCLMNSFVLKAPKVTGIGTREGVSGLRVRHRTECTRAREGGRGAPSGPPALRPGTGSGTTARPPWAPGPVPGCSSTPPPTHSTRPAHSGVLGFHPPDRDVYLNFSGTAGIRGSISIVVRRLQTLQSGPPTRPVPPSTAHSQSSSVG